MILTIAQILFLGTAIALSVLILLQQSKGAGLGASFGAGASATVFGARGAGSFLYKLTRGLALVFFISALVMTYAQNKNANSGNILTEKTTSAEVKEAELDIPQESKQNATPASDTIPLEK